MNAADFARTHAKTFAAGRAWTETDFQTYFDRDTTIIAGTAASYVIGTAVLDEAEILTVATDPAYQRQGKAYTALTEFIDHAGVRGVIRIFLEVAADNTAATALYTLAGFAQIGVRQNYYHRTNAPNCDAIIMQLVLPQR